MSEWPELKKFQTEFRAFVAEREWVQFHMPKNLAMALSREVRELLEHFQWLTPEQSTDLPDETRAEVAQEIADDQIYLTALADRLGVAIGLAVARKMKLNTENTLPNSSGTAPADTPITMTKLRSEHHPLPPGLRTHQFHLAYQYTG